MRDADAASLTDAVLDSFAATPDPRLRTLLTSLVAHLHRFVRETEPSFEEWRAAIDFLTRTGQMCSASRQEFILLSDVLGVSMLVDTLNHHAGDHHAEARGTETTVLGPFYRDEPPEQPHGADVSGGAPGEPLLVEASVSDQAGSPLPNAVVDIWHADSEGFYDVQNRPLDEPALRARFRTDAHGRFHFWSIMPRYYPIPGDGPVGQLLTATARHPNRPAHVHFMISAPGCQTLVTHVFAADSPYLDSDAVFAVRASLIRSFTREAPGRAPDGRQIYVPWRQLRFDFSLAHAHTQHGDPA